MADRQTVFVVDDDPNFQRAMVWLLNSVGHSTRAFDSPGDFLNAYRPDMAGCLVTDLRMPQMSGVQLLERLRGTGSAMPVIVVTAHGSVPTSVQAMKLGALDFLEKPFEEQQFLDLVNAALETDRADRLRNRRRLALAAAVQALSDREATVLRAALAGQSNLQIAGALGIGVKTVETYRARVLQKSGHASWADLRVALEHLDITI